MPCRGLIVTGTDTHVGKTAVAAAIVRLLRNEQRKTGAYKPVVSGAVQTVAGPVWEDAAVLSAALGNEFPLERIAPQRFLLPLAPPVAAEKEERAVDSGLLSAGAEWWRARVDYLVVEGAGGLLSPVTATQSVADLARDLGFPLLIVARAGLGTINQTLLTCEAAERRGLSIAGIVLNQSQPAAAGDEVSVADNAREIAARTTAPLLGTLAFCPGADLLLDRTFRTIEWHRLMGSSLTERPPVS